MAFFKKIMGPSVVAFLFAHTMQAQQVGPASYFDQMAMEGQLKYAFTNAPNHRSSTISSSAHLGLPAVGWITRQSVGLSGNVFARRAETNEVRSIFFRPNYRVYKHLRPAKALQPLVRVEVEAYVGRRKSVPLADTVYAQSSFTFSPSLSLAPGLVLAKEWGYFQVAFPINLVEFWVDSGYSADPNISVENQRFTTTTFAHAFSKSNTRYFTTEFSLGYFLFRER